MKPLLNRVLKQLKLNTPILFLIFNRPEQTRLVFEAIRQARPSRLFVAADGPRAQITEDILKCQQTQEITTDVDWECELRTLIREKNLGCKYAVSSAIDWFLEHVEEGIIIEDDCLPNLSFFKFCEELLAYYRHDTRVMHIGGFNHFCTTQYTNCHYHFTRYSHIWGWATWRRAWKYFDVEIETFPILKKHGLISGMFSTRGEQKFRTYLYAKLYNKEIMDTWGYQWNYAIRTNNGLCIRPNSNLVKNLGFGINSTHTMAMDSQIAKCEFHDLHFPLIHPSFMVVNEQIDQRLYKRFIHPSLMNRIKQKLRK